jgi:hypothetical protein
MPDTSPDASNSTPQPKTGQPPAAQAPDIGHVPMTEEFDRAKWTLPPLTPILIALGAVAIVVAVVSFTTRAKPVAAGAITKVASVDQETSTMVAIQVKLDNKIQKQLWIKDIRSELETADGQKYIDHVGSASEAASYLKSFPPLQEAKADPLREELKIPAGTSYTGFTVFSYPVSKTVFDARKSLTVRIEMYDQPTLVVKQ